MVNSELIYCNCSCHIPKDENSASHDFACGCDEKCIIKKEY